MKEGSLAGKRALVTGAGRGIGRQVALALAGAGAGVAVTARTAADLDSLVGEIEGLSGQGFAVPCDVTDPESVRQMAAFCLEALGGVDILVNNAGSGASHKFVDHPDDLWHRMLLVNLTSVYYVSKAFVPGMVEQQWGRIVNIASIAARTGDTYIAAYTAAKHGVLGLTRALAAELVSYNITVNAVCPGYVDTSMTEASIENIVSRTGMPREQARERLEKMSPQGRLIQPEEIASTVLFLCQDLSKGITGQAINVDGGSIMS